MQSTPINIHFPAAERASDSNAKLYSCASVSSMDKCETDYILNLTVHAADPAEERLLADSCTRAINSSRQVALAMQFALSKLDSVAYLAEPGDTDQAKLILEGALEALGVSKHAAPAPDYSGAARTTCLIIGVEVGDVLELSFTAGKVFAEIESITERVHVRTLTLRQGAAFFEVSGDHSMEVVKVG